MSEPSQDIQFSQFHKPSLEAGEYTITVQQTIAIKAGVDRPATDYSFTATQRSFSVRSERFQLAPQAIQAIFPPAGSMGDHSNVLPHIIFKRGVLPWERSATAAATFRLTAVALEQIKPQLALATTAWQSMLQLQDRTYVGQAAFRAALKPVLGDKLATTEEAIFHAAQFPIPWLALLLFDAAEAPQPHTITLQELQKTLPFSLERGQNASDSVTVIDVAPDLLTALLPSLTELATLAHVRRGAGASDRPETAVVIGNRLPARGRSSIAHLISVEHRYTASGFDSIQAGSQGSIRLVSLKSWQFACANDTHFTGLLTQINHQPSTLRLPYNANRAAEAYLAAGCVPMQQHWRNGQQTVSWYRGPLATSTRAPVDLDLPAADADALLRYNQQNGMFEVTYAAAWELGRLLALQSKSFSVGLYQWKRAHAQQVLQVEETITHLPLTLSPATLELPPSISAWFHDLALLKGIPFNYLVPDERMLPPESIRFFQVDPQWIACLLDGAFSIGRVTSADHQRDRAHTQSPAQHPYALLSGFLLRSEVVAGWPDLQVDGYADMITSDDFVPRVATYQPIRMARLAANVLICLFETTIKTVDIHQKPEALHFGVNAPDDAHPAGYYKVVRDPQTGYERSDTIVTVRLRNDVQRVIQIDDLQQAYQALGTPMVRSDQFALQMIAGVQKVRFRQR